MHSHESVIEVELCCQEKAHNVCEGWDRTSKIVKFLGNFHCSNMQRWTYHLVHREDGIET